MNTYVLVAIAYIVGSVVSFWLGRRHGVMVGSMLTFDLFVRLGYVKSRINERGEVEIEKITTGSDED